jgi:hypothetical protein
MIFCGIHEFSEFFMLKRFWSILALKKCWANWPNAMGKRVKPCLLLVQIILMFHMGDAVA